MQENLTEEPTEVVKEPVSGDANGENGHVNDERVERDDNGPAPPEGVMKRLALSMRRSLTNLFSIFAEPNDEPTPVVTGDNGEGGDETANGGEGMLQPEEKSEQPTEEEKKEIEDRIKHLKSRELIAELKKRKEKAYGSKEELVVRLRNAMLSERKTDKVKNSDSNIECKDSNEGQHKRKRGRPRRGLKAAEEAEGEADEGDTKTTKKHRTDSSPRGRKPTQE